MAHLTESYLEKLKGPDRLPAAALEALSDLDRNDLKALQQVWPGIEVNRRRHIVQTMVELAEDNIELDFSAVLRACLNDTDAQVRQKAAAGLWEDEDPETAELLLTTLENDSDTAVRAEAASTLSHFTYMYELGDLKKDLGEKIKSSLFTVIKDAAEPIEVRRRALEAISYISDEMITSLLIWAYNYNDAKMHVSAIRGMGRSCDARWLPNVTHELESRNPEYRFEAAQACGELEDKRCVPKLLPLLADSDSEVRLAAITALGHIGGQNAKKALRAVVEYATDDATVDAAQEALEEIGFFENPLGVDVEE